MDADTPASLANFSARFETVGDFMPLSYHIACVSQWSPDPIIQNYSGSCSMYASAGADDRFRFGRQPYRRCRNEQNERGHQEQVVEGQDRRFLFHQIAEGLERLPICEAQVAKALLNASG